MPQKHADQLGKTSTEVVSVGVGPHVDCQDPQGGCHLSQSQDPTLQEWLVVFKPKCRDGWIPFMGEMCEVHFNFHFLIAISDHLWIANSKV